MTAIPLGIRHPAASSTIGLRGVLLALTAATGLVDAACYLGMGHVLVANMTGNVVFLGFALAGAPGFSIAAFIVALSSFLAGAAAAGRLSVALSDQLRRWLITAAATQTVLVAGAAIATAAGALGPTGLARFAVIGLLGVAMGIQTATARKLAIADLTTTVLTQTLTGLAADSSIAGGDNPRTARRVTAVAAMLAGALIGGTLMVHAGFTATLAVTAGLFAAITIGFTSLTEVETQ